jgi:hypothetical protein
VVSKAEALAWVRLVEPMVGGLIGQVQVGFLFPEVEAVDLHRTVLAVPLGAALPVFLDLG